jgi:hypothetical protein
MVSTLTITLPKKRYENKKLGLNTWSTALVVSTLTITLPLWSKKRYENKKRAVDHVFNPSFLFSYLYFDHSGSVMVSVLTTSAVDHVFNPSFLFSYLFFDHKRYENKKLGLNTWSTALVVSTLTITPPLWSKKRYENKKLRLNTWSTALSNQSQISFICLF